jgi:hypothetical protein
VRISTFANNARAVVSAPDAVPPRITWPATRVGSFIGNVVSGAPSTVTAAVAPRTSMPSRCRTPGWNEVPATSPTSTTPSSSSTENDTVSGQTDTR